jgi:hypothetical protein
MSETREIYAAQAMGVLMFQHPNATRGWIAQMAFDMADVMLMSEDQRGADPVRPFADAPRIYAEDEAEHEAAHKAPAVVPLTVPDSCRVLGHFTVGFTG